MIANLTAQDFQLLLNQPCRLTIADNTEILVLLIKIIEKPQAAISNEIRMPFSLIFTTPEAQAFTTDYCHFHHPALGIIENLYINRIMPLNLLEKEKHAWYQIMFN